MAQPSEPLYVLPESIRLALCRHLETQTLGAVLPLYQALNQLDRITSMNKTPAAVPSPEANPEGLTSIEGQG